jgi:uronate dehydrogenase
MAKVLVTGSAGAVGRPVCAELVRRGHWVRGFDRSESPGAPNEAIVGDLLDADAVGRAMQSMEVLVHLAAEPHDVDFTELVGPNVLGLYHVMRAAREEKVRRVVLASSIQVLSRRRGPGPASVDFADPGNHYALTKVWAEQMGRMYSRRFGLSVLCVRIAWLVRDVGEARTMVTLGKPRLYLSADDAGRFFARAVEADGIDYAVVYAASRGGEGVFDMEPAKRLLGYEARDVWPSGVGFELPPDLLVPGGGRA